ncbi:MAG: hypothetical protein C0518_02000 [Opitutus sp.]|nr:hypothetical protein [Opitutus sp.]
MSTDPKSILQKQAQDALQDMAAKLLAAQKAAGQACANRYEQMFDTVTQAAAGVPPVDCNVFASPGGRYVVLRGVQKIGDRAPVNATPLTFAAALAWVNQHTAGTLPPGHDAPLRRRYDPFYPFDQPPKPAPTHEQAHASALTR